MLVFELKVKCSRLPCPPEGTTDPEELYMNAKGGLVLGQHLARDLLRTLLVFCLVNCVQMSAMFNRQCSGRGQDSFDVSVLEYKRPASFYL